MTSHAFNFLFERDWPEMTTSSVVACRASGQWRGASYWCQLHACSNHWHNPISSWSCCSCPRVPCSPIEQTVERSSLARVPSCGHSFSFQAASMHCRAMTHVTCRQHRAVHWVLQAVQILWLVLCQVFSGRTASSLARVYVNTAVLSVYVVKPVRRIWENSRQHILFTTVFWINHIRFVTKK